MHNRKIVLLRKFFWYNTTKKTKCIYILCILKSLFKNIGLIGHGVFVEIEAFVASYSAFVACVVALSPFVVVVVVVVVLGVVVVVLGVVAVVLVVVEFVVAFPPHVLVFPLALMQWLHLSLFLLHQIRI